MEMLIKSIVDAGGSIVAIVALVYIMIGQQRLLKDMSSLIDSNTKATLENTATTKALGELIKAHVNNK